MASKLPIRDDIFEDAWTGKVNAPPAEPGRRYAAKKVGAQ
jgi:hypothetical protein